jgi:hypothetical protein
MLTQLARLSLEVDSRYATDGELKFLEDYLNSVEQRISGYGKIRDAQETIVHQVKKLAGISAGYERKLADEQELQVLDDYQHQSISDRINNYEKVREAMASYDINQICTRDMTMVLRCIAAVMLVDDLDRLRDSMLVWYQTIVRAFGFNNFSVVTYKVIQEVVSSYLTTEEAELIMPALQLNHSILSL